jgi:hypothetical protein
MLESRIVAVDHVTLESGVEVEEAMRWFYGELVALDEVAGSYVPGRRLVFRSARIELRVAFVAEPHIDPIDSRVAILVPSLKDVTDVLDDRKVPFEPISGLRWSDRRIAVHDPAGHRIELRQYWPFFVL